MIIDSMPASLRALFAPFRSSLTKPQFQHLWTVVVAWVLNTARTNVLHLAMHATGHRTSKGRFFTSAPWDGPGLVDGQIQRMLKAMRPRRGEPIYLIIDDTKVAKRARKMHGVGPMWIPTQKRFTYGHMLVSAAIEFRGVIMPWRFDVWVPKHRAGRAYRKSTQIAAEFIRAFEPPKGLAVQVLFDAYYLTPVVVRACKDRGFAWFSVASKNRTLRRDGRHPRRRLSDLIPGLLRHRGRYMWMKRTRGKVRFRVAVADGRLKGIGSVRVAARKRFGEPMKAATAIVTDRCSMCARRIVETYERRWRIEELFKELRSGLGLGEYQVQSRRGILHHLYLCGLVHLLLTHHSMEAVGAQARKANVTVTLPSLNSRLETVRNSIRCDQVKRILKHERNKRIREQVTQLLLAA
jgi:SRSO17 transposase